MENNYVIEIEEQGHNLERTPCTQYQHDVDLDCDVNFWMDKDLNKTLVYLLYMIFKVHIKHTLILICKLQHPVSILINFLKTKLWPIISENATSYVQEKLASGDQGDLIERLAKGLDTHENVRLSDWRNTTPDEIKVVIAHIIFFGLLKKASIEQYWSADVVFKYTVLWQICVKKLIPKHIMELAHQ